MAVIALNQYKIFNDPVHGQIDVHPLCTKIIDTPQFQRLRDIKMIGTCYFVYPGASSSSFEHCIGVSHLAGQLARVLQKQQPSLDISNKDILCVEIAGLCRTMGQGPFSHLFKAVQAFNWELENTSRMMFDFIFEKLKDEFTKYELDENDIVFIQEQLASPREVAGREWPYNGRAANKGFLYEIVGNKRNGIDIDRWDHLARDCHGLGIKYTFDHNRIIKFARAIQVENIYQICSRDEEAEALYSMFQLGTVLQRKAYNHPVRIAIEAMIMDALVAANETELFTSNNRNFTLSQCISDAQAYTKLTDSIFYVILMSNEPTLQTAKDILQNILQRQLYKCVGETLPKQLSIEGMDINYIKRKVIEFVTAHIPKNEVVASDLFVDIACYDYGNKAENPMNNVRFYNVKTENQANVVKMENAFLLFPAEFAEYIVRLYCKKTDSRSLDLTKTRFSAWCQYYNHSAKEV